MVSTACCDAPFSHPAPPVMEGWFCTLESTAAEPCSACLTRRALQGQYILSAPYCQLSPSQLRCREALQNLPKPSQLWPALPLGSLHFHTASALAFSAYSLLHFNLSSSSPLPRVCSPLPIVLLRYKPRQPQVVGQTSLPRRKTRDSARPRSVEAAGGAAHLLAGASAPRGAPPFNR